MADSQETRAKEIKVVFQGAMSLVAQGWHRGAAVREAGLVFALSVAEYDSMVADKEKQDLKAANKSFFSHKD